MNAAEILHYGAVFESISSLPLKGKPFTDIDAACSRIRQAQASKRSNVLCGITVGIEVTDAEKFYYLNVLVNSIPAKTRKSLWGIPLRYSVSGRSKIYGQTQ